MKKIVFNDMQVDLNKITLNIQIYENETLIKNDDIYFNFSENISVNENIIAIALSTLCGENFDEIYFDLSIHEKTKNDISLFTNAKIKAKDINNDQSLFDYSNNKKLALNFSGGFDSLSAYYLLKEAGNVELISIKFDDASFLENEYKFFKKFKPHTIETNFRALGYSLNHWTFMGIGSILLSDYLNLKYLTFGTNFESDYIHFYSEYSLNNVFETQPFNFAGLDELKFIQGVTEIGTALIVCNTMPYLVNDSLISLAVPQSEKRYRKELIIKALINRHDLNLNIEYSEAPNFKRAWGTNILEDFLALYLIKYCNPEDISKIRDDIPQEVIEFINNNSLEFYEKFNQNFLKNIPEKFKSTLITQLTNAKIEFYNEKDYNDMEKVLNFLSRYYPHIKKYKHRL